MKKISHWYFAEKGKQFVLTEKGKAECESYENCIIGQPVGKFPDEAIWWAVEKGYVVEQDIPGWTTLKGYQVVWYWDKERVCLGKVHIFPIYKAAENYKNFYESKKSCKQTLYIEEIEYDGVPLKEYHYYNGMEMVDKDHFYGMDAHEVGAYFSEDILMEFPLEEVLKGSHYQIREAIDYKPNLIGSLCAVYPTFKRVASGVWEYIGNCFSDSVTPIKNIA